MGYEVGGAIGAKLAAPDREVYCLLGDGGYMMGHTELYTAIQEGIKINVILFDNNGHQCINNLQKSQGMDSFATEFRRRGRGDVRQGDGSSVLPTEEVRQMNRPPVLRPPVLPPSPCLTGEYAPIDFASNAESYGAVAYRVSTRDELFDALENAKKETTATLIDIKVLPGTMTGGYESWWRVGTAQVADNKDVEQAAKKMGETLAQARPY